MKAPEIPEDLRSFAREFAELCARHSVHTASAEVHPSFMVGTGPREYAKAKITWREGRHGAAAGDAEVYLSMNFTESTKIDYGEFRKARGGK